MLIGYHLLIAFASLLETFVSWDSSFLNFVKSAILFIMIVGGRGFLVNDNTNGKYFNAILLIASDPMFDKKFLARLKCLSLANLLKNSFALNS